MPISEGDITFPDAKKELVQFIDNRFSQCSIISGHDMYHCKKDDLHFVLFLDPYY